MKNVLFTIVFIALVGIIGFVCYNSVKNDKNDNTNNDSAYGKQPSSSDEVCKSLSDIAERLNAELDEGYDRDISLFVKGVTDEEIDTINNYIDTMKGSVKSYSTVEINGEKQDPSETRDISFHIERSDTNYAYDYIVNRKEIPADKKEAMDLAYKTQGILDEVIKDGMSDYEKELAIHDYIVNNCSYGASAANDNSEYSAYGAIVNGKAVCGGYAAAMNLLMKFLQIRLIRVKTLKVKYFQLLQ